jgi:hypothetical protein
MIEVSINAEASAHKMQDFTAVADAYSPAFEMNISMKPVALSRIADSIRSTETIRLSLDAPGDGLSSVTDCTVKADSVNARADGKNLVISGEMIVSAIGTDMQNGPACVEKAVPFSITEQLSAPCENMRCDPEVNVVSSAFSLGAGKIDVRADCVIVALVFSQSSENLVADMSLDDTRPRECHQKTLTLYFADKGEGLWNIAKRYNTSMDAIMHENNLETDTLPERSMLLVPRKHCAK